MNHKYKIELLFLLLLVVSSLQAQQTLSLEQCEILSRENYPLIRQKGLFLETENIQLEKVRQGNWPQMNLNGNISYQSDVVHFPIELPNLDIPTLSKDQYKLGAELVQPLTGWLTTPTHKELVKSNTRLENEKLEVELYKITEKVQQIYFAVLLLDEQLIQTDLFRKDLETGLNKTRVAIENGVSLKTNADIIQTEMLKLDQKIIEIKSARQAYLDMLAVLTGEDLNNQTVLIRPESISTKTEINRPELGMFKAQNDVLFWQSRANEARTLPQAMLFLQGGYGKPGLNILVDEWDWFYIGGLKLSWNINSLFERKNERNLLAVQQNAIQIQQDAFLKNTDMEVKQALREINKIEKLILKDRELIELRRNIIITLENQLENGVITSSEYLNQLNAEDQARQNLALHQLQHLMAQYQLKRITN